MKGRKITVEKIFSFLLKYIVEIWVILISVFPIIWVIMSSFKTNQEILSGAFTLPSSLSKGVEAYKYIFENYNFLLYFKNSVIVAGVSTIISLIFFAMAAYVLGKYRFPGKGLLFALFTVTMLVPGHSKAQPIFQMIMNWDLYDTMAGLIFVYLGGGIAMSIFVLRSAFMAVPKELDEAALLDGAGFFSTFIRINLPLAKSGLATAGILMFLGNWNEYFYAALLTSSEKNRTLPIALQFFNQSLSYDYTKMFAALTIVVLPAIILYCCAQEQVQQSVASSGVKG